LYTLVNWFDNPEESGEDSFVDQVVLGSIWYTVILAYTSFNVTICYLLVKMSSPLSEQQNASLINHIRKRNQRAGRLMGRQEAEIILIEVTARLAHAEDEEYDPNMEIHERVFATFMA
jgi:cytochrome c biogenesis protein ResB